MNSSERRSPSRVLIVESDDATARLCLHALRNDRITAQWVGATAVAERMANFDPQLYIIGEEFKVISGPELCARIRARTNVPIIITTTNDTIGHQIQCFNNGADDVLLRPLTPPLVMARVLAHLRRAYQYSVPATHVHLPQGAQPPREAAPAAKPAQPQIKFHGPQRQCKLCDFTAPMSQFEQRDEHGRVIHACPVCGEALRNPVTT